MTHSTRADERMIPGIAELTPETGPTMLVPHHIVVTCTPATAYVASEVPNAAVVEG